MTRVSMGIDYQAKTLGGDVNANVGDKGTSTAIAATTLTDGGKTWTTNQWAGKIVATGNSFGIIRSNSVTVLTIDQWYDSASATGASVATPATGAYAIISAGYPARWMGVTENATGAGAGDTSLAGELTGSGWDRRLCVWAHSAGVASYTLTTTFTSADGTTRILAKMGLFSSKVVDAANSIMFFETLIVPSATLISGDQCTATETVSL